MPRIVRCPSCDTTLEVAEDQLGRSVRCGRCASVFTATESGRDEPVGTEQVNDRVSNQSGAASVRQGPRRERHRWEEDDDEFDDDRWSVRRFRAPDLARIRAKVTPPAVFLMVYGILLILGGLVCLLAGGFSLWRLTLQAKPPSHSEREDAIVLAVICGLFAFVGLIIGPLIVWGAVRMKALRSYGLALTATILSSVVGFLVCMALLLVGIWPLIVLLDPDVRAAFDRPRD